MSSMYDDFENRFTKSWFSSGWVEIEPKPEIQVRKDLATLQEELQMIEDTISSLSLKQLRLANLAKLYQ